MSDDGDLMDSIRLNKPFLLFLSVTEHSSNKFSFFVLSCPKAFSSYLIRSEKLNSLSFRSVLSFLTFSNLERFPS